MNPATVIYYTGIFLMALTLVPRHFTEDGEIIKNINLMLASMAVGMFIASLILNIY